jgi:hypothetical protein
MTPTLLGRWETRFCLLATVGVLIALAVGYGYNLNAGTPFDNLNYVLPLTIMGYVLGFGLVWDVVYQASIYLRWERDWPTTFQVLAGFIEGTLIWLLLHYTTLLPLPHNIPSRNMPFRVYLTLYGVVWLVTFLIAQGPLRIFLLRWRYQGGEWYRRRRRRSSHGWDISR